MREAMAGEHLGHLLIELCCRNQVGMRPFRLDKVYMAVPERCREDHPLTIDDTGISGIGILSLLPTATIFPSLTMTAPFSIGGSVGRGIDFCADKGKILLVGALLAPATGANQTTAYQ